MLFLHHFSWNFSKYRAFYIYDISVMYYTGPLKTAFNYNFWAKFLSFFVQSWECWKQNNVSLARQLLLNPKTHFLNPQSTTTLWYILPVFWVLISRGVSNVHPSNFYCNLLLDLGLYCNSMNFYCFKIMMTKMAFKNAILLRHVFQEFNRHDCVLFFFSSLGVQVDSCLYKIRNVHKKN